jgi:superfamily II DNA or RNA helicase
VIDPRDWQIEALRKFHATTELSFLLEATPGAGKTIFTAFCARELIEKREIDFAVIVVPTTALKGDKKAGFLGDWSKVGLQITPTVKEAEGPPSEFRGGVVTYQQLPHIISTFETWARNGVRLMFVVDEGHHASEDNRWGTAVESIGRIAKRILVTTGTPFRGDGRRISFVKYDKDGKGGVAIPDFRYTYREAVRDRVCRQVIFMTDDGMADFILNEQERKVRISEAGDEDVSLAAATIFKRDSEWLKQVIEKADAKLDDYRVMSPSAGGLVICRPGDDDLDIKHLNQVALLVKSITGEQPEVITHDDPDANAKIERFRDSSTKWICAVRKISEGVDIKRLRVEVLANRPSTELMFRQVVGRVVRVEDKKRPGDATVFMAKFPQLTAWAEKISEEAEAGLRERKTDSGGGGERKGSDFIPLGSTHEDGGAISDFGEIYGSDEVNAAELLKRGDPQLIDVSVVKLAHVMRKLGVKPDPAATVSEPLHVRKKRLRETINKKAKRKAFQNDPERPDFAAIWVTIHRATGAKNIDDLFDNYSIDVMRQVDQLLDRMLGVADAGAS